jgi:hypothetical protein
MNATEIMQQIEELPAREQQELFVFLTKKWSACRLQVQNNGRAKNFHLRKLATSSSAKTGNS